MTKIAIINFLFVSIGAVLIYLFLNRAYSIKVKTSKLLFFIFSFSLINGFLSVIWLDYFGYTASSQILKSILLSLISIFIIYKLLKISILNSIIAFCILGIGMSIGNSITPLAFAIFIPNASPITIMNNFQYFIVSNIIINLTAFVFILFTSSYKKIFANIKNNISISIMLFFSFILLACNAGIYFIVNFHSIYFIIASIIILFYAYFSIWYIYKYSKYETNKEELEQQIFYNTQLDNTLHELKRFKHDINNHLYVIDSLINNNKLSEAKDYINEIFELNKKVTNTSIYNIKNAGLFGIISSKITKAEEYKVNLQLKIIGIIESIPGVKISELCEIIGILLDNAIEAAQNTSDKNVEVEIISTIDYIDIYIKNDCYDIPDMKRIGDVNFSSKGQDRGNGLNIVKNIISKYENILNSMKYDEIDSSFIQTLTIAKKA